MPKPRLTDEARRELAEIGATKAQILELDKVLPVIAALMQPQTAANSVRDVLTEARDAAARLVRIVDAAEKGSSEHLEALGLLGNVGSAIDSEPAYETAAEASGTLPELARFDVLVHLLGEMTQLALQEAPKSQRRGRVGPAGALERLMGALERPEDPESKRFAERVRPTLSTRSKRNLFPSVSRIVFTAATGSDVDPRALVDAYRKRPRCGEVKLLPVSRGPDTSFGAVVRIRRQKSGGSTS